MADVSLHFLEVPSSNVDVSWEGCLSTLLVDLRKEGEYDCCIVARGERGVVLIPAGLKGTCPGFNLYDVVRNSALSRGESIFLVRRGFESLFQKSFCRLRVCRCLVACTHRNVRWLVGERIGGVGVLAGH